MSVTLDGHSLFGKGLSEVNPDSLKRDCVERTIAGLDGVVSIDLGTRSRRIVQRGVLRAKSRQLISERKKAISAYIDGGAHTLVTNSGEKFDNLRMDVFTVSEERIAGDRVEIDYEIVYTQLRV